MKYADQTVSGIVSHVSKNGTEVRFEGSNRRYQGAKGTTPFRRFVPGDRLTLGRGEKFPESLRFCRILKVQYRPVR